MPTRPALFPSLVAILLPLVVADPARGALVCSNRPRVIDVTSPVPVAGDTTGGTSSADVYQCADSAWRAPGPVSGYSGPEDVYELTLTASAVVSFAFSAAEPDMRLFLLGGCDETTCLHEGGCGENLAPGRYWLVVDGLNGAEGRYSLTPYLAPPATYNRWTDCPTCGAPCGQPPSTIASRNWRFRLTTAAAGLPQGACAGTPLQLNGDFELGTDPGLFSIEYPGSTDITDWSVGDTGVGGSSVDYIGTLWADHTTGSGRSLDMSGDAPGMIFQSFATVINQVYDVSFWMVGNLGAPDPKELLVSAGDVSLMIFRSPAVLLPWVQKTFSFTATAALTTLTFEVPTDTANYTWSGPVLDDVVVVARVSPVASAANAGPGCAGSTLTLDGSPSTGCTGAIDYRWLDGATPVCDWSATPTCDVTLATTTVYTLEVRCASNPDCVGSTGVAVEVVPYPVAALAALAPICAGDSATLDASASAASGCAVPLEYEFRDGLTVLQPWSTNSTYGPFAPTATTSYAADVRCTAFPGCATLAERTLTVVAQPRAAAGPDVDVCAGTTVTLDGSASTTASCPAGALFAWREGTTVLRPFDPSPSWQPPNGVPGVHTYTLVVACTSLPTCTASDLLTVRLRSCTLAVRYLSFAATRSPDGAIAVSWITTSEDRTLGFRVERAARPEGPYAAVGAAVEAAGSGSAYTLRDQAPAAGKESPWYRVVELTDGGRGDETPPFTPRADRGRGEGGRQRGIVRAR